MIHARLEKLGILPDAAHPNPAIWDGYFVMGYYAHAPEVGQRFEINRYERNGVVIDGIMTTTPVAQVTQVPGGFEFETANSRYRLTHL